MACVYVFTHQTPQKMPVVASARPNQNAGRAVASQPGSEGPWPNGPRGGGVLIYFYLNQTGEQQSNMRIFDGLCVCVLRTRPPQNASSSKRPPKPKRWKGSGQPTRTRALGLAWFGLVWLGLAWLGSRALWTGSSPRHTSVPCRPPRAASATSASRAGGSCVYFFC